MVKTLRLAGKAWLSHVLRRFCETYSATLPSALITRSDDQPYFRRFYISQEMDDDKPDDFGVFIHEFVGSDPLEEVHAHPWIWMVSIILAGGYHEEKHIRTGVVTAPDGTVERIILKPLGRRPWLPFDVNVIFHNHLHRVDLMGKESCWTLFIHGPRVSTWGFANEKTGKWREIKRRTKDGIVRTDPPPDAAPPIRLVHSDNTGKA